MSDSTGSQFLLFYPTSPVHVRDLCQVISKMPGWKYQAIVYEPLARVAPGIPAAIAGEGLPSITLDDGSDIEKLIPNEVAALILGAVFEPFALLLCHWAKQRNVPVVAIEEVAQLGLNQFDINNYDAPFDRLFVASPDEQQRFLKLGYPAEMLHVSGLLANDRFCANRNGTNATLKHLGLDAATKPIVYTTSPLRGRLSLHNKDDLQFRQAVLREIAQASRKIGRRVVVKLHPNEDVESNRRYVADIIPDAIVLGREVAMDEMFAATGLLVNRGNSQTCLEAVLRGVPTVVAACGLKTLFHDDGGARVVEDISQLGVAIEQTYRQGVTDPANVKAKHFYLPIGGVAEDIAKEIASLASNRRPPNENNWHWLIKSMLFVGRQDHALRICTQLAVRTPWQDTVRLALESHAGGRQQDAISAWQRVIGLDPHWYYPHYELAHGYQASADYDRAIKHAEQAMELHPPFHTLWHEIPMRVVIMNSLRQSGRPQEAAAMLHQLEERGLVGVVPELLIEKSAQLSAANSDLANASHCLDAAIALLDSHPVDKAGDDQLRNRALDQARQLIEQCNDRRQFLLAESLCLRVLEFQPDDLWSRFRLAQARLMLGKITKALRELHSITRVPNGPRDIVGRVVAPVAAKKLDPYWPKTPRSLLGPIKLVVLIAAWSVSNLIRSRTKGFANTTAASLLVAIFVIRHFFRRLSSETLAARRTFRMLRRYMPWSSAYRCHHVKHCPICSGPGKFEYENKLTPLFRCRHCNHVYAGQLPNDQVLSSLYGDVSYWEKDRIHQGITTMKQSAEWDVYLNARLGILERLELVATTAGKNKSVFEIGCAEGMLLHALRKRGMTVAGCEMNRAVAAEGMKHLGVDIRTEPFESLVLPERHCDLVISFHTLEHMRYPEQVLAKIAKILRPDGSVLIEVPCGKEEYENTDHLHFFSETSLRLLLDKFFSTTDILDNSYTNGSGVRIGSIYGVGRGVR